MASNQICIENNLDFDMHIALEPEGTLLTLSPKNKIEVSITSEGDPALSIIVSKYEEQVTLSLWPDKGTYEMLDVENFII